MKTTTVVYHPTPRSVTPVTDPRVAASLAAVGPIHYVAPAAAARIIDAAVNADIENGVHRTQLYPLFSQRRALTKAIRDPGSVVKRHKFESGVKETREHWRLRAVLAVLQRQAGSL